MKTFENEEHYESKREIVRLRTVNAALVDALRACLDLMPPLEKPAIAGRAANRIEAPVILKARAALALAGKA